MTKPDITRQALNVAQLNAVDCLAGGMNDHETAEAVVDAEAKRRRYDPLQDLIDGGRVTETERRAVLRELTDLAG